LPRGQPKLFLLDEPLSNLDAEPGVTMVHVTHDQVEAMRLADHIVVLRAGRVELVGSPQELYDQPSNTFVAGVIGSPRMNFLEVEIVDTASGPALTHPALPEPLRFDGRRWSGRAISPGQTATLGLACVMLLLTHASSDMRARKSRSRGRSEPDRAHGRPVGKPRRLDADPRSDAGQ
jgi:hypothetical protein